MKKIIIAGLSASVFVLSVTRGLAGTSIGSIVGSTTVKPDCDIIAWAAC